MYPIEPGHLTTFRVRQVMRRARLCGCGLCFSLRPCKCRQLDNIARPADWLTAAVADGAEEAHREDVAEYRPEEGEAS